MSNYNLVGIAVQPPYCVTHENGHTFVRKGEPGSIMVSIDLPDADKMIYNRLISDQTGGHTAAISIRQLVDE